MSGDDERDDKPSLEDTTEWLLLKAPSFEVLCNVFGDADNGDELLDRRPIKLPINPILEADEEWPDSASTSVFWGGFGRVKVLMPSGLSTVSIVSFNFLGFWGKGGGREMAPDDKDILGGNTGFSLRFEAGFGAMKYTKKNFNVKISVIK